MNFDKMSRRAALRGTHPLYGQLVARDVTCACRFDRKSVLLFRGM